VLAAFRALATDPVYFFFTNGVNELNNKGLTRGEVVVADAQSRAEADACVESAVVAADVAHNDGAESNVLLSEDETSTVRDKVSRHLLAGKGPAKVTRAQYT
jgi:hypothetical protein